MSETVELKPTQEIVAEIKVLLDNCHVVEDIDIAAQHEAVLTLVHELQLRSDPAVRDRVTDEMVEAAMSAFIAAVRQQDKEWTDDIDEEQLLTSPSGDWFAPFYPIRDALTAALRTSPPEPARPVAYQQFKNGKWQECSEFVAKGWSDELSEGCRALYAAPTPPAKEPQ